VSESLREAKILENARTAGGISKLFSYSKISGPGIWIALAALSAGSLVGSLGLGQKLGTEGLWIQAWAMILGMFSLWTVSHIVLNSQQSLFSLLRNEWNPSLGLWLAGSAMITNFAWCMPQFRFGADITGSCLLPFLDHKIGKVSIAFVILACSVFLSIWYEKSGFRSKLIQWLLRVMLGSLLAMLLYATVIVQASSSSSVIDILSGFIPNINHFNEVSQSYEPLLEKAGEYRSFWEPKLLTQQRELALITFSSTLGVNLLFALPLMLLGRGWKRRHNGFSKFNLFVGLLVPFIICSSCITLLSSTGYEKYTHEVPSPESLTHDDLQKTTEILSQRLIYEMGQENFEDLPPFEQDNQFKNLSIHEHRLALSLLPFSVNEWVNCLSKENSSLKYVLGASVLLISFSTIVILMILNGHLFCEILNKPHRGAPFQSGSLILALSSVGPFILSDQDNWVADPSYILSLAILPFALLSFILMLNSKEILGRECPKGLGGWSVNLGAFLSFLCLGSSSFYLAWNQKWGNFPIGQSLVILIGILVLVGYFSLKIKKLSNRISGLESRLD
jgi:hypothetical protein